MTKIIRGIETESGKEVNIRYFFCCDRSTEGIDVYDSASGDYIGEMIGERFPDEDDEESMNNVIKKLDNFLNLVL